MSVSVSVPDELYRRAVEIAKSQNVSVDEVFASAFAEIGCMGRAEEPRCPGKP
jgi:hypothetical protein